MPPDIPVPRAPVPYVNGVTLESKVVSVRVVANLKGREPDEGVSTIRKD
jgi:hypothetical protein